VRRRRNDTHDDEDKLKAENEKLKVSDAGEAAINHVNLRPAAAGRNVNQGR
jgi:hypothetical protein